MTTFQVDFACFSFFRLRFLFWIRDGETFSDLCSLAVSLVFWFVLVNFHFVVNRFFHGLVFVNIDFSINEVGVRVVLYCGAYFGYLFWGVNGGVLGRHHFSGSTSVVLSGD